MIMKNLNFFPTKKKKKVVSKEKYEITYSQKGYTNLILGESNLTKKQVKKFYNQLKKANFVDQRTIKIRKKI